MNVNSLTRKAHYWGSIAIAIPILLIILTGFLLHSKKYVAWVQPEERRGVGGAPTLSLPEVLEIARGVPEAGIATWDDVDRIDVRPDRGALKITSKTRWEVQIDTRTGEVLQSAYRRSDLIESLHDGTLFGGWVRWVVFVPAALVLLGLWVTGLYLFLQPLAAKRRRRARAAEAARTASGPANDGN